MNEYVVWFWDPDKDEENWRKHRVDFDTARFVFVDPLATTMEDSFPNETRYKTTGMVGRHVLVVIHTLPEFGAAEGLVSGRIISARRASTQERRSYEEGTR